MAGPFAEGHVVSRVSVLETNRAVIINCFSLLILAVMRAWESCCTMKQRTFQATRLGTMPIKIQKIGTKHMNE